MKIEVGKKYVSRDGKVVTIVKYDNENNYGEHYYPYRGDNSYSYTEDGCFYVCISGNETNINDLVEEYSEDNIDDCESREDLLKEYKQDENMNEKN